MATMILGICDPHLTERRPRSRKDDFVATQRRKIRDVFRLAAGINWEGQKLQASAIVIAGDVFHQPQGKLISRVLDHGILSEMRDAPCSVVAIPGNHDMEKGRLNSLRDHPLGVLAASGLVELLVTPKYLIVGDDPPVIIVGREFTLDGPGSWLNHLRNTQQIQKLKQEVSQKTGKNAQVLVLTHCHWGPRDSMLRGEPIIGHNSILGTGVDSVLYGHPHTLDGTVTLDDEGRQVTITGPGALTRGTLAEHDTTRKPAIALYVFGTDGKHQVSIVTIPHEPAEAVFDLERHQRVKKAQEVEQQFVRSLAQLDSVAKKPEEVMTAVADRTPAPVLAYAREWYAQAEVELRIE